MPGLFVWLSRGAVATDAQVQKPLGELIALHRFE